MTALALSASKSLNLSRIVPLQLDCHLRLGTLLAGAFAFCSAC